MSTTLRFVGVALFLASLLHLSGCGETKPPLGSAQSVAIDKNARAASNRDAADKSGVEAARLKAQADALEVAAKAVPTEERIKAAVDARVAAAVAAGIHGALIKQADDADRAAEAAQKSAQVERNADLDAADARAWVKVCRIAGLVGVVLGILIGGAIAYFVTPTKGILVGTLIFVCGIAVAGYGATVTWLPAALLISILVALAIWGVAHFKDLKARDAQTAVAVDLSRVVDAVESGSGQVVSDAKETLRKTLIRTKLQDKFDDLRSTWREVGQKTGFYEPIPQPVVAPPTVEPQVNPPKMLVGQ